MDDKKERVGQEKRRAENFPTLIKDVHQKFQEAPCPLCGINTKKTLPGHSTVKLLKCENHEVILKAHVSSLASNLGEVLGLRQSHGDF